MGFAIMAIQLECVSDKIGSHAYCSSVMPRGVTDLCYQYRRYWFVI